MLHIVLILLVVVFVYSDTNINILSPLNGDTIMIDSNRVLFIRFDIVNFDLLENPSKCFACMIFDKYNDAQLCMPITDLWPIEEAKYSFSLSKPITGQRSIELILYNQYNRSLSGSKSTFYVLQDGESMNESMDVYTMTSTTYNNIESNEDMSDTNTNSNTNTRDSTSARKLLFNSIFEGQLWGRRKNYANFNNINNNHNSEGIGRNQVDMKSDILTLVRKDINTLPEDITIELELDVTNVIEDYSISGPGSTLGASYMIRNALVNIINQYNIERMLDVPCGDMHWISRLKFKSNLLEYIGSDISTSLLEFNQNRFKTIQNIVNNKNDNNDNNDNNENIHNLERLFDNNLHSIPYFNQFYQSINKIRFEFIDIVQMNGEEIYNIIGDVDLLFNRHMMFHLSSHDNVKVLHNIEDYGRIVLKNRKIQCNLYNHYNNTNIGKCNRKPFYFMSSTAIFKSINIKEYILLLGNIDINLMKTPYCMKFPLTFYRDGINDIYTINNSTNILDTNPHHQ